MLSVSHRMRTLTESAFLSRIRDLGVRVDDRYPQSAILAFHPNPGLDRFWEIPAEPERRPYFIACMLAQMGDWKSCYAWRHMGSWPASAEPLRINDVVELRILRGLELPLGTGDVVEFNRGDEDRLITLIFATTVFGWSVGQDLYLVPNDGRYILKATHHGVVDVAFRDTSDLERWAIRMGEKGFSLPSDVPDSTFKVPTWMKPTDG